MPFLNGGITMAIALIKVAVYFFEIMSVSFFIGVILTRMFNEKK